MKGENLTLLLLLQGFHQLAHIFARFFWLNSYKGVKHTFRKNNFIRGLPAVSRNCLHFKQHFSAKLVINTGQSGPLKTISPEIFFDIIADGCIVYPYKLFLRYLKLSPIEKNSNVLLHHFACDTFANLVCQFWLVSGSKLISICFIFRSVIQ